MREYKFPSEDVLALRRSVKRLKTAGMSTADAAKELDISSQQVAAIWRNRKKYWARPAPLPIVDENGRLLLSRLNQTIIW